MYLLAMGLQGACKLLAMGLQDVRNRLASVLKRAYVSYLHCIIYLLLAKGSFRKLLLKGPIPKVTTNIVLALWGVPPHALEFDDYPWGAEL